ncbi:MAG TPA: PilZ domain-containing protein [Bryobacteraceae bacterium]
MSRNFHGEGARLPHRTRVLMTAILFTPSGAQKVRIQDLSARGAKVLTDGHIVDGCDALFKRGVLFAAARIVWSRDGKAGLSFYRELSQVELESAFNPALAAA